MIEFSEVCAAYENGQSVLDQVSFCIEDGEFVAFVGTNGAGKSTLMRLVNGLLKPTSGQVSIDGVPTTELKTSELAKRVGFLFQDPDRQICCSTVREELLFGFKVQGRLSDEAEKAVDAMIERLGLDPDAEPFSLSSGMRQLLALASVVVLAPPIVVLDEPTECLDARECHKVMQIVAELNAQGTTVLMVCHDIDLASDYAQRMIALSQGRIVADEPSFELLRNTQVLAQASLRAPQITEISMKLARELPQLKNTAIARANTLEEMTAAIKETVKAKECAA